MKIANSLHQEKGTSQLPEVTTLVGASDRTTGLLKFSRDPENETALLGFDKLPHITGGLEGYAYVQNCTEAQGTGEGPSYPRFLGWIQRPAQVQRRHEKALQKVKLRED